MALLHARPNHRVTKDRPPPAESVTLAGVEFREFARRFRVVDQVARGGMGRIEAAFDPLIGRRVAIKTLHSEIREDERAVAKFVEEARITGQLEHPNVVPIYDLGEGDAEPFFVMRLVQGKSLAQVLVE